jgi:hypothetical protein
VSKLSKLQLILIFGLAVLGLVAIAFKLRVFPERYDVRDDLGGVAAFWHQDEAFVFVSHSASGHRHSWLTDHATAFVRMELMQFGLEEWRHFGSSTSAYRIAAGRVERFDLAGTPVMPIWDLEDGKLTARPHPQEGEAMGFRWEGSAFGRLPAAAGPSTSPRRLEAETEDAVQEEDASISSATKERLRAAGWLYRRLSGYEAAGQPVELVIQQRDGTYGLVLEVASPASEGFPEGLRVSVSLSLPAPASSRVLFSSGGWRAVSRDEFERLASASRSSWSAGGTPASDVCAEISWVLGGLLAIWLLVKGPTRGLKITFVVFVLLWAIPLVKTVGFPRAIVTWVVPVAMGLGTLVVSTRFVSYSVKRNLLPVGEDACPAYARPRLKELTAAFEQLGLRFREDRQSIWRMMSAERKTFIRFFGHGRGHVWAEVQAMDSPRVVGRMLVSVKGDTRVLTCDLQSNQELLRDPLTVVQRVPRSVHCGEMLAAHDALVMKTPGTTRTIDDPVAASVEAYEKWVEALRRLRQIEVNGERYKISLRAAVPVALRVIKAWFH